MLTRRKKIALLALALAGAVGWTIHLARPVPEPVFGGRPISDWLEAAQTGVPAGTVPGPPVAGRSAAAEAREAIAAIGPEALPYIGAAAGKESVFRSLYRRIYNGLPAALNRHLTRPKARGKPLSPTQTLSLFNVAIGQADAAAIPILSSVCASGNSVARHAALVSLLRFASQDPEAVFRVLRKALRDDDPRVRNQALIYLCEAARTDPRARSLLAERLEALGPDAPEWLRQKGGAALEPNRGDSREGSATR